MGLRIQMASFLPLTIARLGMEEVEICNLEAVILVLVYACLENRVYTPKVSLFAGCLTILESSKIRNIDRTLHLPTCTGLKYMTFHRRGNEMFFSFLS